MSGNKKNLEKRTGLVELASLGGLSKSSHHGFVLVEGKQKTKLRRDGGNPFYDPFFETYLDQKVEIEGIDMESYLLVKEISILDKQKGGKK